MRLYNIYCICKKALEDLYTVEVRYYNQTTDDNTDDRQRIAIVDYEKFRDILDALSQFAFIKKDVTEVNKLIDNGVVAADGWAIYANRGKFDMLFGAVENKIQSIVDMYESMKETKSQHGIDIYIPPCKYLHEYMSMLKDIDFIMSQCPYLRSDNEEIQYNGTDTGSDWIILIVVTTGVVTASSYILHNFAEISKKVLDIKGRLQIIDQNEEFLKTLKIRNELLQEMQEIYEKEKEAVFNNAADELKETLGNLNDGEEEGKVLVSLKKYSDLLKNGVRFYSSIEAPPEIKELLPSSDNPKALTDTIVKYIENKDDKN